MPSFPTPHRARNPLLACALAAATVLLAPALSASGHATAVTPRPGRYAGSAGPFTLSFKVAAGAREITHLVTMYNPAADCGIATNDEHEGFPTLAVRKGRFTGTTVLRPPSGIPVFFSIEGSFSTPTRAAGTVHGRLTVVSLPTCSDHVSFTAQRVGA